MASKSIKPNEWDTIGKAAKEFDLPRTTIVSWVSAGHLQHRELAGGTIIVKFADVAELVAEPPTRGPKPKN